MVCASLVQRVKDAAHSRGRRGLRLGQAERLKLFWADIRLSETLENSVEIVRCHKIGIDEFDPNHSVVGGVVNHNTITDIYGSYTAHTERPWKIQIRREDATLSKSDFQITAWHRVTIDRQGTR